MPTRGRTAMQLCGNRLPLHPSSPAHSDRGARPISSATAERGSTPRNTTALTACVSGMSTPRRQQRKRGR